MYRSLPHVLAQAILRHVSIVLALALLAAPLAACNDHAASPLERAAFVHTEVVQPRDGQASLTLTGEVQARFSADLSFRVSGRVLARLVDVGTHVNAGDLLARLDPAEQQARALSKQPPLGTMFNDRLRDALSGILQVRQNADALKIMQENATLLKMKYDAYVAAGFTADQGFQIVLTEIAKPRRQ